MPPKKKMSPAPLPPPSLREELGIPPSITDTEMQDLLRPPLVEMPMPEYTFGSQNIGPTAIRAGAGVVGGILQGVGGPLGTLGSMATNTIGEDLAQRAEVYTGIRDEPDLGRVGTAGLMGAIPFPALRTATPLVREAGQAAFNTALPVGMVAAENAMEGRPQSAAELGTAGGLGLLTHGAMRGAGVGIGTLLSRGHVRPQVAIEGTPFEQALGPAAGAAVYHGTGATWPPEPGYPIGRPTLEKVRTGTGGMAQGHGFYVAQNPEVGNYYREVVPKGMEPTLKLSEPETLDRLLKHADFSNPEVETPETIKAWMKQFGYWEGEPNSLANAIRNENLMASGRRINTDLANDLINIPKGNLYTLDLPDEHLDKMLDWDKPMAQQPEPVKKLMAEEYGSDWETAKPQYPMLASGEIKPYFEGMTGSDLYHKLSAKLGGDDKASQYLLSKGIIGNKYLDASSRGKDPVKLESELNGVTLARDNWKASNEPPALKQDALRGFEERIAELKTQLKEARAHKLSYNLVLFDPSLATPIARNNEPVSLSTLTGKPNLPPDVKPIGTFKGLGEQYNLERPGQLPATFTVPFGGDFNTELAKVRKRFGQEQGGLKDILGNQKGMAAIGEPEPLPVTPARLSREVQSDPGYVYHATNAERLSEIAASGKLKPHRPNYGTDQSSWPDRGTESRSYFSRKADVVWQFAPEDGTPVLIRTRETPDLRAESTGDVYSRKPIPTSKLEYLGSDGNWHSLSQRIKP